MHSLRLAAVPFLSFLCESLILSLAQADFPDTELRPDQDLVDTLNSGHVDGVEVNLDQLESKNDLNDLLTTVKNKFGSKLQLALSVPTKTELVAKFYELKTLTKLIDFFILQTAFMPTRDETVTFHPSRLSGLWDTQNTDSLVDLIHGMGAPLSKLVIAAPVQAFKFTLKNATHTTPGSAALDIVSLTRNELCERLRANATTKWILERDQDQAGPYIFKDNEWIAFDDEISIDIKAKYARIRGLAGLALKDLSQDSVKGSSCTQLLDAAFDGLSKQTRAPRAAVLQSLSREISDTHRRTRDAVQVSPFRITRIIDVEGKIHVVRQDSRTEFQCSRQGYFVHPRSCGRFYRCVKFNQLSDDFNVFEFDCPAGLAFDSRYEVCVWPGSLPHASPCSGSSEIAPVPQSRFSCPGNQGYFADPENCRWFFACLDHGRSYPAAYEFRCPFGLVFDEDRLLCEWPWLVPKCGGGSIDVRYQDQVFTKTPVNLRTYDGLGPLRVDTPLLQPQVRPVVVGVQQPETVEKVVEVPERANFAITEDRGDQEGGPIAIVGPSSLPEQPQIIQQQQQQEEKQEEQLRQGVQQQKLNNLIQEQFENIVKQNLQNVAQQGRIFNSQNYDFGQKTVQYTGTGPLTNNNKFVAVNLIENANVRLEDLTGTPQSEDKTAQLITVTTTPIRDTGIVGAKITLSGGSLRDGVDLSNNIESITPIPIGLPRPVASVFSAPVPIVKPDIQTVPNGVVANVPELQFRIVPNPGNYFLPNFQNAQQYFLSRGSSGYSNVSHAFVNYVSTTTSPAIAHSSRVPSIVYSSTAKPIVTYDADEYTVAADNVQSREAIYPSPPPLIHLTPVALSGQGVGEQYQPIPHQPIEAIGVTPKGPGYYINYPVQTQVTSADTGDNQHQNVAYKSEGNFQSSDNRRPNLQNNQQHIGFQKVFLSPIPISYNYQNTSNVRRVYDSTKVESDGREFNSTQSSITSNRPLTSHISQQGGFLNWNHRSPLVPLNSFGTVVNREPILVPAQQQNSHISEQYGEKNLRPIIQLYQQPSSAYRYQNVLVDHNKGSGEGVVGVQPVVNFQTYYYPKQSVKYDEGGGANLQQGVVSTSSYPRPTVKFAESYQGKDHQVVAPAFSYKKTNPEPVFDTSFKQTEPSGYNLKPAVTPTYYYYPKPSIKLEDGVKVSVGAVPTYQSPTLSPVFAVQDKGQQAVTPVYSYSSKEQNPASGLDTSLKQTHPSDYNLKPAITPTYYYPKPSVKPEVSLGAVPTYQHPVTPATSQVFYYQGKEQPTAIPPSYNTNDQKPSPGLDATFKQIPQIDYNVRPAVSPTYYYYPKPLVKFEDGVKVSQGSASTYQSPTTPAPSHQVLYSNNPEKQTTVYTVPSVSTYLEQKTDVQSSASDEANTPTQFYPSTISTTPSNVVLYSTDGDRKSTVTLPTVPVLLEQKPAITSSFYYERKDQGTAYGATTPQSILVQQTPKYEGKQPVEEAPFVSRKAYVTGNDQKTVTVGYSTPLPTVYTHYGSGEATYTTQKPLINFNQPQQVVRGGYHYPKPTVVFSDGGNYYNQQPVEEQPFVARKAYVTGTAQGFVSSPYPQTTPAAIIYEDLTDKTIKVVPTGYKKPQPVYSQGDYKQPVYEPAFVAQKAYTTGPQTQRTGYAYPKPSIRFDEESQPREAKKQIYISTPGPFSTTYSPRPTLTTSIAPVVIKGEGSTLRDYYEDNYSSTERGNDDQSYELNANHPIIVKSENIRKTPSKAYLPGKIVEDYNLNGNDDAQSKTYVMTNDFHSFLPAKLSGQCTCNSNPLALRRNSVKALPTSLLYGANDDEDYVQGNTLQNNAKGIIVEKYEAAHLPRITSTTTKSVPPTYFPTSAYTTPLSVEPSVRISGPSKEAITDVVEKGLNLVKSTVKAGVKEALAEGGQDRFGHGGWRSRDETLQGNVDCQRAGLFRHPNHCNKFYTCRWDCDRKRFTLHVFNCPVHLTFDNNLGACNWPSQGPACAGNTLLPSN